MSMLLDPTFRGKAVLDWCDTGGQWGEEYRQRVTECLLDLLDIPE